VHPIIRVLNHQTNLTVKDNGEDAIDQDHPDVRGSETQEKITAEV
jgi:hypothetical protein